MASYSSIRCRLLRAAVFKKYGARCVRCGFEDTRALQIDHVHGMGKYDKKIHGGGIGYLTRVLNNRNGHYQILCANCNWIKRVENYEVKDGERLQREQFTNVRRKGKGMTKATLKHWEAVYSQAVHDQTMEEDAARRLANNRSNPALEEALLALKKSPHPSSA